MHNGTQRERERTYSMSKQQQHMSSLATFIPPQHAESKRDKKRRETVNKIESLHDESWRKRDEKYQDLYRELHNDNRGVASQPPTSSRYLLSLYPFTIERDALLTSVEMEYQYKIDTATRLYEIERENIEAMYWDAREQARQRLLSNIEERRRKLKEEKEGGDVVADTLFDAQVRPRPLRHLPYRARRAAYTAGQNASSSSSSTPSATTPNDLLLHSLLAPNLSALSTKDILSPSPSSLAIIPPAPFVNTALTAGKRGPRGAKTNEASEPPPETASTLPNVPAINRDRGAGAGHRVAAGMGPTKSLEALNRMIPISSFDAQGELQMMLGNSGRGTRRGRAE